MKTQYVGFKNSAKYVFYSNVVNIIRFYSNYYCSQISNSIISKIKAFRDTLFQANRDARYGLFLCAAAGSAVVYLVQSPERHTHK